MDSCGAVLDVSHMSDRSIEESLEVFNGPVEASHSACRALSPGNRQLPDHLVRSVVERNGVIGIPMSANMLFQPTKHNIDVSDGPAERSFDLYRDVFPEQGPERGKYRWPREAVTLEDVGDHIDHVCQIAGDASHVGIGGDTDGITQGNEGAPAEGRHGGRLPEGRGRAGRARLLGRGRRACHVRELGALLRGVFAVAQIVM